MTIFAFVNSNILKRVFSVVALARRIIEVLRPNQNGVSSWCRKNLDVLSSWACNVEFRSLKSTIEIIDVHKSVVF
jgi:hypothetical protein